MTELSPDLLKLVEGLSLEDLKETVTLVDKYEQRVREEGPSTDEELWWWIKKELGIALPRKAIVEGNHPPFQFVADLYFQRVGSVLLLAPRGGGKTLGAAIVHYLDCLFKPGYEGLTFGADLAQAAKGYEHLRRWLLSDNGEKKDFLDGDPTALRTNFKNGSKVSIVPGCLPPHVKVITPDGAKTISSIVSNRDPGPVKSYNFETEQWEWNPVVNWFSNGRTPDWMRLRLKIGNQSSSHLAATPEHEIYMPDGSKKLFRNVQVGDHVCVPGEIFSDEQEQVFMGTMLGDGNIHWKGRLRLCHGYAQEDFLDWKTDVFSEFSPSTYRREAKNTKDVSFRTIRRWKEALHEWYPNEHSRPEWGTRTIDKSPGSRQAVKRIPDYVWGKLDALGLAVWLMDDGTWTRLSDRGQWNIAAMHFNEHERAKTTEFFERIGIETAWYCVDKSKDQWVISTKGRSGLALQALVSEYIDTSEKQASGYKRWVAEPINEHSHEGLMTAEVEAVWEHTVSDDPGNVRNQYRYDIEVEGNHNYCK
jgi:hypothetical protein